VIMADKVMFRNCLVAMQPSATKLDLPLTHDIMTYVHNSFIDFFSKLKSDIQVCFLLYSTPTPC
ncbi:hypothetical protein K503DRAFT_705183, partial [Rhizopogon vinicolor AM-OR11-026]